MKMTLRERIKLALEEDLSDTGDVTTASIFPGNTQAKAHVIAKEAGVFSGKEPFSMVFDLLGSAHVEFKINDGDKVSPGDEVCRLSGSIYTILAGERTALNFIQHLSGVATKTHRFVQESGGQIAICDTRKTTPLWRDLEKQAVSCGGGTNHRMGLYDMIMIKDTHADGAGGLNKAIQLVKMKKTGLKIAAEARNLEEVQMALDGNADLIMLDNMSDEVRTEALELIGGQITTEITGGITEDNIDMLASLKVDRVSIGALTHSVNALDFSLRITEVNQ